MPSEPTVLLHLGPDVPSRVAFVAGVPASTGIIILGAAAFHLSAWTWPFLAVLWILILWYIIATATIALTEVSSAGLTVLTALRHCYVPWPGVSDVRRKGARLNVYTVDGGKIAISQYGLSPLNVWLKWPRRQVRDAQRLQEAIDEARNLSTADVGATSEQDPWIRLKWRVPLVSWRLASRT